VIDWQKQHYKSLETAYRISLSFLKTTSVLSSKKSTNSIDLNFETLEIISKCLRVKFDYITTSEYATAVDPSIISRLHILQMKRSLLFERYTQVFDDKHGFVNNLSVLDLLFNEGKFTLDYLQNQRLNAR
jgi:hypothetical protein